MKWLQFIYSHIPYAYETTNLQNPQIWYNIIKPEWFDDIHISTFIFQNINSDQVCSHVTPLDLSQARNLKFKFLRFKSTLL